jgi:hypothetical protein
MNKGGSLPIGGILLQEYSTAKLTNHVDKAAVAHLRDFDMNNMTDFGLLDLWAYARKEEQPFMVADINPSTIQYVKGNKYKFALPSAADCSTYLVSVQSDNPEGIGANGKPFFITVKGDTEYGFGAQIMFDQYLPYVLTVMNFQRQGEQTRYEVTYNGNSQGKSSIPAHLLQEGSRLFSLGNVRNAEFSQKYGGWSSMPSKSVREYIGMLSTAEIQTHYHFTDEACSFFDQNGVTKKTAESVDHVIEYVGVSGELKSGIKTFNEYLKSGGDVKNMAFRNIAMKYDDISIGMLAKQNMNFVIWHPGGPVSTEAQDQQWIQPGIWHQLDYAGYKHTYNIDTLNKDIILSSIRDFNSGKVADTMYGKERIYRIRTGRGGRKLLNQIFAEELRSITGTLDAKEMRQIEGNNVDGLTINLPWYQSIRIPGEGILVIEEDSSFENETNTNEYTNPRVFGGERLSSYSMIIQDYDTSSSNIKILRNSNIGRRVSMNVVSGDRTHPMFEKEYNGATVHQGSNVSTGFAAYFRSKIDTGFVVDPTKLLKLVPINPLTGVASL